MRRRASEQAEGSSVRRRASEQAEGSAEATMTSWRWIVSATMNGEAKRTCWGSPIPEKGEIPWNGVCYCGQGRR